MEQRFYASTERPNSPVSIGGSAYTPENSPQLLEEYLDRIARKANEIEEPFERSLFLMVQIAYLQPFLDVNKRTGRVAANIPLLENRLAPLSFTGVDPKEYIGGLLEYYEGGDVKRIAQAYVDGYVKSAPHYSTAVSIDQTRLKIFSQYRTVIKEGIARLGDAYAAGQPISLQQAIEGGMEENLREAVEQAVKDYVLGFTDVTARADKLTPAQVKGLLLAREDFAKWVKPR